MAREMRCSLSASTLEVASSRISTRGSASSARANEMSWRWPVDRALPPSCTSVLVAFGQALDEVVHADDARDAPHLLVARRSGRPKRMLSRIEPLNRKASCGTTASCSRSEPGVTLRRSWPSMSTAPSSGVVEARQQLDDGRLAGAGGADEGDRAARQVCAKLDVVQHVAAAVAEAHVGEVRPRPRTSGSGRASGASLQVGIGVEHRVDLLHGRHRRLEGVVELGELLDRVEEAVR